jgi:hypothetical protein
MRTGVSGGVARRIRAGPRTPSWELPFDDGDRALRAGEPVVLWSSELFDALFHAGQPTEGWHRGEANDGRRWLLDEHDRLSEWVPQ